MAGSTEIIVQSRDGARAEPAPSAVVVPIDASPYFRQIGTTPFLSTYTFEWRLNQDSGFAELVTNLPVTVIRGSPTGWAWGSRGSGAQDLALNILNQFFPPFSDGFEPICCQSGLASQTAFELAPKFVEEVIAQLDASQPAKINVVDVQNWIATYSQSLVDRAASSPLPKHFPASDLTHFELDFARATEGRGARAADLAQARLQIDAEALSLAIPATREELQQAFSVFARDLRRACRDGADVTEFDSSKVNSFRSAYYWGLAELARTLHAIDVQTFRAEAAGELPPLGNTLTALPEVLQGPVERFLNLYWQLTDDSRQMVQSGLALRYASSVLGASAKDEVRATTLGDTVTFFCRTRNAFDALYRSFEANGFDGGSDPKAFYSTIDFEGRRLSFMALLVNQYSFSTEARSDVVHERQHAISRLLEVNTSVGTNEDTPIGHALADAEQDLWDALRDELLSFGIEGRYSEMEYAFGAGAAYDFPQQFSAFHQTALSGAAPELSLAEVKNKLDALYDNFYQQSAALCTDLAHTFGNHDGKILPYFQLLQFSGILDWSTHIWRMQECGLISSEAQA